MQVAEKLQAHNEHIGLKKRSLCMCVCSTNDKYELHNMATLTHMFLKCCDCSLLFPNEKGPCPVPTDESLVSSVLVPLYMVASNDLL